MNLTTRKPQENTYHPEPLIMRLSESFILFLSNAKDRGKRLDKGIQ
jgi:hypothetical protein